MMRLVQYDLNGLAGTSLTGFLAGLGVLQTLDDRAAKSGAEPPLLAWSPHHPRRARLWWKGGDGTPGSLAVVLADALGSQAPAFAFEGRNAIKNFDPAGFGHLVEGTVAVSGPTDRFAADLLAGLANEAVADKTGEALEATALNPLTGAGHQDLLKTMRDLCSRADASRLEASLFHPWRYEDRKLSLNFDPSDRAYAYRWANPSDGKGVPSEAAANRLAATGLACWPTAPQQGPSRPRLATVGCKGVGGGAIDVSWPLWADPLPLGTVKSLLALADLLEDRPPSSLAERGVTQVMRVRKVVDGKFYRYLVPTPLWSSGR
jgi:hypothetical protein